MGFNLQKKRCFINPKSCSQVTQRPLIGIIIPLIDESLFIEKQISDAKELTIQGVHYKTGEIKGKNVVLVLCGMGMINAAMISTRLIADFHPDLILMSGSSGSINPTLQKGDVIVGNKIINVDFGEFTQKGPEMMSLHLESPQNNTPLPLTFTINEEQFSYLKTNPSYLPKITFGSIATSDSRPNSVSQTLLLQKAGIDVIEMEGAALMQVCWFFNTSGMIIRGVSDKADTPGHVDKMNMELAGNNAAKVLLDIIAHQPDHSPD